MHLSILTDSYLTDSIADQEDQIRDELRLLGRRHKDSLKRGIIFALVAVTLLIAVVTLSSGRKPSSPGREIATHIRVTHVFLQNW